MRIAVLRGLVGQYEQTWYLRKFLSGDHEEAIKIKHYLAALEDKLDDYELSSTDLFGLIKIILCFSDRLQLVNSIKSQFRSNYFFDIVTILNGDGLIDEDSFSIIHGLPYDGRLLLYNIFCCGRLEVDVELKQKILGTVLALLRSVIPLDKQKIQACFLLLAGKGLLNETTLQLFIKQIEAGELNGLLRAMQALDQANQLNEMSVALLANAKSLYVLSCLLNLLNRADIDIDHLLLVDIFSEEHLLSLEEICEILIAPDVNCLNKNNFLMLLTRNSSLLFGIAPVLRLLQAHSILNEERFKRTLFIRNAALLAEPFQILADNYLLGCNELLVDTVLTNELFDTWEIREAISFLNNSGIINQETVANCFSTVENDPNGWKLRIFACLGRKKIHMDENVSNKIGSLSENNSHRLYKLILELEDCKLLDKAAVEEALQRIRLKLNPVEKATVIKKSRKITGEPRSEFTIDNKVNFFAEHSNRKKYERGGFGIVKKGYSSRDSDRPLFGIKKLLICDPKEADCEAVREVKYHRLLGRQSFYFSRRGEKFPFREKTVIVTDWQEGGAEMKSKASDLMHAPFEQRLQCLVSGLEDVNVLHAHYRVHGDINPRNFILDLKNSVMSLIDFGASRKRWSVKQFAYTQPYLDRNINSILSYDFCDDMYAMGIVTACLFPELYEVTSNEASTIITMGKKVSLAMGEKAIVVLVNNMMNPARKRRCTSEDALSFCQQLISHLSCLDEALLKNIIGTTIDRPKTTVEDVLRGVVRT